MRYDKYGGYKKLQFDPGYFFRLGQAQGRDYLISPDGNGYRALGINHFHMIKSTSYDSIICNIKKWGFNAGCYQGPKWMWERIPYTQGINLVNTCSFFPEERFSFQDVFDSAYIINLKSRIKQIVEPQSDNKMLIGYFLTDIPVWTRSKYGLTWLGFFKSLDVGSPGGKVWSRWRSENPDSPEEDFLGIIARQVYFEGTKYIREYDKNHLIFSDRYSEDDIFEKVLVEALPFVDAIATQPSNQFHQEYYEKLYMICRKPIYVADHVSSFATEEHLVTLDQVTDNEKDYLDYYEPYICNVMSLPHIIGYNKCQYMDEIREGILKQGLIKANGKPYNYVKRIHNVNKKALKYAYGKSRTP